MSSVRPTKDGQQILKIVRQVDGKLLNTCILEVLSQDVDLLAEALADLVECFSLCQEVRAEQVHDVLSVSLSSREDVASDLCEGLARDIASVQRF